VCKNKESQYEGIEVLFHKSCRRSFYLKTIFLKIDHTRHRFSMNFVANLLSGLVAYHFRENKPKIDLSLNVKSDTLLLI